MGENSEKLGPGGLSISFSRRFQNLSGVKREILIFLLVGAISFLIDIGGFNLFLFLGFSTLMSSFFGTLLAIFFNFVGNLKFTFSHKGLKPKGRTVAVYLFVAITTLALNQTLMWIGISFIPNNELLILNFLRASVIVAVMAIRFVAFKFWVFV